MMDGSGWTLHKPGMLPKYILAEATTVLVGDSVALLVLLAAAAGAWVVASNLGGHNRFNSSRGSFVIVIAIRTVDMLVLFVFGEKDRRQSLAVQARV